MTNPLMLDIFKQCITVNTTLKTGTVVFKAGIILLKSPVITNIRTDDRILINYDIATKTFTTDSTSIRVFGNSGSTSAHTFSYAGVVIDSILYIS